MIPEVLFVSQGSIRKIKIYSAPDGTKKGDALITYTRSLFIFTLVERFGYLLLGCSAISVSFIIFMLILLLMPLAGLHF
jgi:hypothetical protein